MSDAAQCKRKALPPMSAAAVGIIPLMGGGW